MSLTILDDLVQGTPEWHDARRGIVTASVVGKLISLEPPSPTTIACPKCKAAEQTPCMSLARKEPTPVKTFHSERMAATADLPRELTRADNDTSRALVATLVAERVTGWTEETPMNSDMWRGVLHEPIARAKYAEHNGATVDETGFMIRDDWGFRIGASPDGLIGEDGGLEIKCPRSKTHIRTIISDEVPAYYMAQVQACLLVSGRKWWDFVSFCGGLPLWTKRVLPDPKWRTAIIEAATSFETAAGRLMAEYEAAIKGLPLTERVPDDLEVVI